MFKKIRNFLCIIILLTILFPHVAIPTYQTYDFFESEEEF